MMNLIAIAFLFGGLSGHPILAASQQTIQSTSASTGISNPQLAAQIQDLTHKALGFTNADHTAIVKGVAAIYKQFGLPTIAEVGDDAAYGFVFLVANEPRSFQTQMLPLIEKAGRKSTIPKDAATFFKARYRLEGIKKASDSRPPTNPRLRDQILRMMQSDQSVRKPGIPPDVEKMREVDRSHTAPLQKIFEKYGVPTYSMVGSQAAGDFVMMIQHQPAPMQKEMLPSLKVNVKKGEADPESYALLYDHVQMDHGRKQLYGERFSLKCGPSSGGPQAPPIEDPEHIDQRRAEIGLMRFELYSYVMDRMYDGWCSKAPPEKKAQKSH